MVRPAISIPGFILLTHPLSVFLLGAVLVPVGLLRGLGLPLKYEGNKVGSNPEWSVILSHEFIMQSSWATLWKFENRPNKM